MAIIHVQFSVESQLKDRKNAISNVLGKKITWLDTVSAGIDYLESQVSKDKEPQKQEEKPKAFYLYLDNMHGIKERKFETVIEGAWEDVEFKQIPIDSPFRIRDDGSIMKVGDISIFVKKSEAFRRNSQADPSKVFMAAIVEEYIQE